MYERGVRRVMEERAKKDRNKIEKEHNVSEESVESRLREAAGRVVPDEAAKERIIGGVKAGRESRKRLRTRIPAAVFATCLLFFLMFFARSGVIGNEVVVYAATEENGWQKLEEGERILLKMEPFMEAWTDEDFDEVGRCTYFPYKCVFRVEIPERYVYDRQMVMIRDDDIIEYGDRIEWWVAPNRPEDAGRVMQSAFRLWIVDENRERQAALELELTKEDDKCYAELKRVWESEAYKKEKRRR